MDRRIQLLASVTLPVMISCQSGGGQMFESSAPVPGVCAVESNLVTNCGFDYESVGWEMDASSCSLLTSECLSGSGCLELKSDGQDSQPVVSVRQCVQVDSDGAYQFAAHLQIVAGVVDYCELGAHAYTTSDCGGFADAGSLEFRMFQPANVSTENLVRPLPRLPYAALERAGVSVEGRP